MSYKKQMQKLVRQFEQETGKTSYSTNEIARWAIDNNLWVAQGSVIIRRCASDFGDALREEYKTDPQGRRVRTKHVANNGEQIPIWSDMSHASKEHMARAFQQRRKIIVGECKQLKTDVDSYNDNYNNGAQIHMVFDMTSDLLEHEMAISNKKISSANEPEPLTRQFSDVVRQSTS